ncbi:MAG TPA: HAMP domain-containing sensor histidine kinase [Chryseolinea sp.]|nr:HAMP domain-containing sensor histidine kinase [Chryseolinea sp.]
MEKAITDERLEDFAKRKRNKLFENISLFATVMGTVHFVLDLIGGSKEAPVIDMIITIVLFTCYVFHRKGYRNTSRILGLSFLNLCLAVYACLIPANVGVYLFFFPLMAVSMAIFEPKEKVMRMLFVLLPGVLSVLLFASDFDLIGPYEIEMHNVENFFMINLLSSGVLLVMSVGFMLRVNEESERRLRLLAEEIEIKNTNLEKTNAELDRFFYSTSHDLRSPLLSIKGLVNITRNETVDKKVIRYLDMMTERADRLDLFIQDIIDYSKNSRTAVSRDIVDVTRLVDEVKDNFQFLDGAENIRFQNDIYVESAITDKTRLTVVLNNLISNAIKYHRQDSNDQWIKVDIYPNCDKLTIIISDNGLGISKEKQSKIFDMFYRGTETSKGSGLGLYIVKETIEKMNGSIRVESEEGEGTSFIVTLPVSSMSIVQELATAV